ncbi:hypothetical protein BaRGS_00002885 [Batillaria attramentaria]|uniref:G-protein coupled receptors family 1 profile domain-containing protein n=1 Tax=Batillaria attramentaria TaxID=370345 RepID=A0ABD0M2S5_9CAEN
MDSVTSDGCLVVDGYAPWSNPDDIISQEVEYWVSMVTSAGLIPLLCLIGVPGNALSAAVFYRQGLRKRINLCLFSLALADVMVAVFYGYIYAEGAYREVTGSAAYFVPVFIGFTGFAWVSQFLSAVIASERCFCVVSPFRAQKVLKTSSMAVIIVVVSAILLGGMLAIIGPKHSAVCIYHPATNTTRDVIYVTDYYLAHKEIFDVIDVFIYSAAFPIVILTTVVITTVVTATKLQAASRWRQQSATAGMAIEQPNYNIPAISTKELALTKMLIATSLLLIVCMTPTLLVQLATFMVPDLNKLGRYHNLMIILWAGVTFFRVLNSSLNFFVYYYMGSKFRETLKQVVTCRGRDANTSKEGQNSDHRFSNISSSL